MVTTVRGAFKQFEGTATIDTATPANSKVSLKIDTASVDTGNADRDAHILSGDFFENAAHPYITFESTAVDFDGETWEITGDLTIKGVTKPVTVPFEPTGSAKDPFGNIRVGFEGATAIIRSDWGLTFKRPTRDWRRACLREDQARVRRIGDQERLSERLTTITRAGCGDAGVEGRNVVMAVPWPGFAEHLTDTGFSLVLADHDGRVVHTWAGEDKVRRHLSSLSIDSGFLLSEGCAGTNGIGTVLEEGRPVLVIGDEHYSEPLRQLTCAGTPIRNPITGRLAGVLDLACPRGEWSKLGSPALAQLRHDLEGELAAKASLTQRLLFERFTARCRETSAPVVGVSDQYMITNAAATDLLSAADQGVIWTALSRGGEAGGVQRITLSNGRIIEAKSQVIRLGGSIGGHLIELASRAHDNQPRRRRRRVPTTVESTLDDIVRANPKRLLIIGEPGVGKRTAAQQLHQRINGNNPIVMVSCELSRVADGQRWLGELAAHLQQTEDTVVLPHLDLLTEPVAKTVVALLERSKAGPRIMATASHDFADNPWNGALREALGELTLSLPPLRDRRPELGTLAAATLRDIDPALHVSGRALAALHNYDWPGNFVQPYEA